MPGGSLFPISRCKPEKDFAEMEPPPLAYLTTTMGANLSLEQTAVLSGGLILAVGLAVSQVHASARGKDKVRARLCYSNTALRG